MKRGFTMYIEDGCKIKHLQIGVCVQRESDGEKGVTFFSLPKKNIEGNDWRGGRRMMGRISDENSMRTIVTNGILPAIGNVLKSEGTVDSKICEITNLVNAYNDFYLTGRHISPTRAEGSEKE